MKIVITGASGFLGRELIPELQKYSTALTLVGRDKEKLSRQFPEISCADYDEFERVAGDADAVLHLAVINNDHDVDENTAFSVNAHFAEEICRRSAAIGVSDFVFISSTHALDLSNTSVYARSKRHAAHLLQQVEGIEKRIVYIPAVLGRHFAGKLSPLNRLPSVVRVNLQSAIGALKPTVSPSLIAKYLSELPLEPASEESPIILSNDQNRNWVYSGAKFAIDYTAAIAVIVLLWWLFVLVWIAVRLHSAGPGFFIQPRVGRDEAIFRCYKFRTMYVSAPSLGTHEVSASMVTPLGSVLRRTKLDELPQAVNILLNQMSLVGPRPCLPVQSELIEERRSRGVFGIKPGITGLAQVNDVDMSDPVKLARLDRQYVKLRALLPDLSILVRTALGRGSGDRIGHP